MKEIYADCASTTPISEPALRVMTECMRTCYGNPSSSHHCGREAARVLEEARDGIAACNTHSVEPSHVLTAMGLTKERAGSCIRISFSADHTEEDIDQICSILKQEVARARQ